MFFCFSWRGVVRVTNPTWLSLIPRPSAHVPVLPAARSSGLWPSSGSSWSTRWPWRTSPSSCSAYGIRRASPWCWLCCPECIQLVKNNYFFFKDFKLHNFNGPFWTHATWPFNRWRFWSMITVGDVGPQIRFWWKLGFPLCEPIS